MNWLTKIPHRYAEIPRGGTANIVNIIRMAMDKILNKKVAVVCPSPFSMLDNVVLR